MSLVCLVCLTGWQSRDKHSVTSTTPTQVRKVCFQKEDQDLAKHALETLTRGATPEVSFQEDSGKAKVVFSDNGWAAAPPEANIRMVADADACIQGTARRLDFYRANGVHVGYADPELGLKVLAQDDEELQIGDSIIRVGDLADDVMPKLSPYKVGTASSADPANPSSLAVKHFYRISEKAYTVEFRRRDDPGPYRVFAITSGQ
jgi:hypothetical protein